MSCQARKLTYRESILYNNMRLQWSFCIGAGNRFKFVRSLPCGFGARLQHEKIIVAIGNVFPWVEGRCGGAAPNRHGLGGTTCRRAAPRAASHGVEPIRAVEPVPAVEPLRPAGPAPGWRGLVTLGDPLRCLWMQIVDLL